LVANTASEYFTPFSAAVKDALPLLGIAAAVVPTSHVRITAVALSHFMENVCNS
jgi:hypothetical protein